MVQGWLSKRRWVSTQRNLILVYLPGMDMIHIWYKVHHVYVPDTNNIYSALLIVPYHQYLVYTWHLAGSGMYTSEFGGRSHHSYFSGRTLTMQAQKATSSCDISWPLTRLVACVFTWLQCVPVCGSNGRGVPVVGSCPMIYPIDHVIYPSSAHTWYLHALYQRAHNKHGRTTPYIRHSIMRIWYGHGMTPGIYIQNPLNSGFSVGSIYIRLTP